MPTIPSKIPLSQGITMRIIELIVYIPVVIIEAKNTIIVDMLDQKLISLCY
jgi:hypothetical protein